MYPLLSSQALLHWSLNSLHQDSSSSWLWFLFHARTHKDVGCVNKGLFLLPYCFLTLLPSSLAKVHPGAARGIPCVSQILQHCQLGPARLEQCQSPPAGAASRPPGLFGVKVMHPTVVLRLGAVIRGAWALGTAHHGGKVHQAAFRPRPPRLMEEAA